MYPQIPIPCPCSAFTSSHPVPDKSQNVCQVHSSSHLMVLTGVQTPFFKLSTHASSFYHDPPLAQKSAKGLEEFDADPNVLMCIAHDPTCLSVFEFFPDGTMNDWQKKGWKEKLHWSFLSEMPYNGKVVWKDTLVDGLYKGDEKIRGLDLPAKS
jgi:hypothetical protein